MMTDDEVAAVHEAAHAVFAVFGAWTRLAGPVVLKGPGHGDVVMATDADAIRRAIGADPWFDRDLPRIHLIRSLLAGPIAEGIFVESGRTDLSEAEVRDVSRVDYRVIAEQLAELKRPRPGLLERLEREVREGLERPATWSAVERFAAVLIERRRLEAEEATAILAGIGKRFPVDVAPARRRWLTAALALMRRILR